MQNFFSKIFKSLNFTSFVASSAKFLRHIDGTDWCVSAILLMFTFLYSLYIVDVLDASGSRSETPGKFWNVVLEKDGEDQLDWSCEKWRSAT
jgi:hypothetical protein